MDFILEQGFDIQRGRMVDFQAWLAGNEKELRNSAPDGCEYLGTYAAIFTSEKKAGSVRTLWRLDSYGAQDRLAEAWKAGGPLAELFDEYVGFMDPDSDNWSNTLLKAVTDATVYKGD